MAAEVAAPLAQAKKITMVSSGDGEVGAAKLTGEVLDIMAKVPNLVKNLTGIDMAKVKFFSLVGFMSLTTLRLTFIRSFFFFKLQVIMRHQSN